MDIEHLNKSQIILLTLLVSFVTSIATGIVTVSLMEQAPPVIAQTVNRVIERTIQTVASSTPSRTQAATVITQEKTVVVNESELIAAAIKKIEPSIVRVYNASEENPVLLALGIVLDGSGKIATDSEALGGRDDAAVVSHDGKRIRMFVTSIDRDNGLAFLQESTTTPVAKAPWVPAQISGNQTVLGESVVAIAGKTTTRISPGIVTTLIPAGGGHIIDTNVSGDLLLPGSPIVNTQGALLGVSTMVSRTSSVQGFIPALVLVPAEKK